MCWGCFLHEPDVRFAAHLRCQRNAPPSRQAHGRPEIRQPGLRHVSRYAPNCSPREDIDAVLIATGPNWHATASILAATAGKDVYCEKPSTKNIAQSLALAETFRRTGCVFQAGTQRRSLPNFVFAIELARQGKLGKLNTVYAHPAGFGNAQ